MFPRITGHCKTHHIPKNAVKPADSDTLNSFESTKAIAYLKSVNADLIKGDIVLFDSSLSSDLECEYFGVTIFNGEKLIHAKDCEPMPSEFRVIENDVPIKYWETIGNNHGFIDKIWFDQKIVIDQILKNISFDVLIEDKLLGEHTYALRTHFTLNNKQYFIIYDYLPDFSDLDPQHNSEDLDELKELFINELKSENPLLYDLYSDAYNVDCNFDMNRDDVLFLSPSGDDDEDDDGDEMKD